jgi:hypothetical protein
MEKLHLAASLSASDFSVSGLALVLLAAAMTALGMTTSSTSSFRLLRTTPSSASARPSLPVSRRRAATALLGFFGSKREKSPGALCVWRLDGSEWQLIHNVLCASPPRRIFKSAEPAPHPPPPPQISRSRHVACVRPPHASMCRRIRRRPHHRDPPPPLELTKQIFEFSETFSSCRELKRLRRTPPPSPPSNASLPFASLRF